jgi:hypothetical protein
VTLWRLPRPDFHRLVDTDFQDTPLTLRPARSPSRHATLFIESFRQLRRLCSHFDCYVERISSRAEVAPTEVQRPSRRTLSRATTAICEGNQLISCGVGSSGHPRNSTTSDSYGCSGAEVHFIPNEKVG